MNVALDSARILSLCAGFDGLSLGLRIAFPGARVVGIVERQAYPAAALVAGMEAEALDQAPVWDCLESFDGRRWRGAVDLVCAGFPCQPWSAAGKQLGLQDERWLWPAIARIIGECEPRYVFLENVPDLRSKGGLVAVLRDLANLGFDAEWDLFSAAEIGANHERERIFIFGFRPDADSHEHESGSPENGRTAGAIVCADPGGPRLPECEREALQRARGGAGKGSSCRTL